MSSLRKAPNIWALASVTYGAVILVTVLSIGAYFYVAPKRTDSQITEATRSVTVGSVWMPVYPGATLVDTSSTNQDKTTESTLHFETKDPAGRVLTFYQAALKKGVFRFNTVVKTDEGGIVRSMAHNGKTSVVVTIQSTGEGSRGEIRTIDRDLDDKGTRN